jgi:hypothetical protein
MRTTKTVLAAVAFVAIAIPVAALAQAQLRPVPPFPKAGLYSCSPQYMAEQISKTKAAMEVSDSSMTLVVRSAGEGASECYDKYKHPHYLILKAYFYLQSVGLDVREQPPDIQGAAVLNCAATDALDKAVTYDLDGSDQRLLGVVQALGRRMAGEFSDVVAGTQVGRNAALAPVAIDGCALQPLIENGTLLPSSTSFDLGITFHATTQTVTMVEFVFWFQDAFGDKQGIAYSGIANGKYSPGIVIAPRRALIGYLGRTGIYPNEAVWPLYSGGKSGNAACVVYKMRLANGATWTDHKYDSTFPYQLP